MYSRWVIGDWDLISWNFWSKFPLHNWSGTSPTVSLTNSIISAAEPMHPTISWVFSSRLRSSASPSFCLERLISKIHLRRMNHVIWSICFKVMWNSSMKFIYHDPFLGITARPATRMNKNSWWNAKTHIWSFSPNRMFSCVFSDGIKDSTKAFRCLKNILCSIYFKFLTKTLPVWFDVQLSCTELA